jgi:hypothetical protein
VILLLTVIGAAIGFASAHLSTTSYRSSAVMMWDPSLPRYGNTTAYVPDAASLVIQVQAQMSRVYADDVMQPASKKVGLSAAGLREAVTVTAGSSTGQFVISSSQASASRALALTKAVVESYVTETSANLSSQYTQQADALQDPINALTTRVNATAGVSNLQAGFATQLSADIAQQASLRADAENVLTPLTVSQDAVAPTGPSSPSAKTLAVIGGSIGLVIGLAIVALMILRTFPNTRRHSTSPVESPLLITRTN